MKRALSKGQSMVEYGIILTTIALACWVGFQQVGNGINNGLTQVSSNLSNPTMGGGIISTTGCLGLACSNNSNNSTNPSVQGTSRTN